MANILCGFLLVVFVVGTGAFPVKHIDADKEEGLSLQDVIQDKTEETPNEPNREGRQFGGQYPGQFGQFGGYFPGQGQPNFGLNLANANAFASPAGSNANSFSATGDIYNGFTLSKANSIHTPGINSFLHG